MRNSFPGVHDPQVAPALGAGQFQAKVVFHDPFGGAFLLRHEIDDEFVSGLSLERYQTA